MSHQDPLFDPDDVEAYYTCIDEIYDEQMHPILRRVETPELIEGVL